MPPTTPSPHQAALGPLGLGRKPGWGERGVGAGSAIRSARRSVSAFGEGLVGKGEGARWTGSALGYEVYLGVSDQCY
jgi:hypothetical protein